jgi:hypothetical protein
MRSLTTFIDILFSLTVIVDFEPLEELDDNLSSKLSFTGLAFWWSITRGDCLRSRGVYSAGFLPASDFAGNG